eukprot:7245291-Karenia_brevis.AAC.1
MAMTMIVMMMMMMTTTTMMMMMMMLSRWRHEIQIAILRRRAAMHRAVLPKLSAFEQWLLTGNANLEVGFWHRHEMLEEDNQSVISSTCPP